METKIERKLQISPGSGGGTTARVSLPAEWLRDMQMSVNEKGQTLQLTYDKKEKSIKLRKFSKKVSTLS